MTRSQKLVPLLCREKNLVPDIFSIIIFTSASEAVARFVLKFIENLLSSDNELDNDDSDLRRVLLLNLDELICSMQGFFFQSEVQPRGNWSNALGGTEMRIFKLLSMYGKDPLPARKFIDILLPFSVKGVQTSGKTRDLNATSAMEVGALDYDTVVNAYEKINADFFYTVYSFCLIVYVTCHLKS